MKKLLLLFVMMLLSMVASADVVEIDGIYYNLITKGKVAEVTSNPNYYTGSIVIPESINYNNVTYSVTSIGVSAFRNCSGLISITIPNSVTSIESYAFYQCFHLTSVTIPNSVTSIEEWAFFNCPGLTSVTIPNSVTNIGNYAFYNCSGLTSVTIGNSVTSIGIFAFQECLSLTSITIPNSMTTINNGMFYKCSGLISVTIPNSVTSIGGSAFSNCTGLTSITIPNSVTRISSSAFANCYSLTSITIGNSVTRIDSGAFSGCSDLIDVTCYSENVPSTPSDAFKDSYIEYSTLHVPFASIGAYATTEPWRGFGSIVPLGDYYELSITSGAHGIVTYDNQSVTDNTIVFPIGEGSDLELTITPTTGYQVSTLTVNGEDVKSQLTNGVLTISNVTANMTVEVTFELIPGYTENIKMSVPSGDRTAIGYSSSLGLDFTGIEDVKAWIVTGFTDDANVLLSRVRIVPPYTGLYLTSNVAGVEVDVPTTDKDIYYANLLKAAVEEETIQPTETHDGVEFTNFVVGKLTSGEMGFVRVKTARTLGPNKSRLLVPSSYYPVANAAHEFNVEFLDDDATTDIKGKEAVRQTANQLYDLQGRMISVSQAGKGIYIYKGKKYVIK